MEKVNSIYDMPRAACQALSGGEWPSFLRSAAWNFRFSFPNQLLIYAQRPRATACYSFDEWHKRFDRRIRKGSKGITLIDDSGDQLALRYVFDYRDTWSKKNEQLTPWELTEEKQDFVRTALADSFLLDEPEINGLDFAQFIHRVTYKLLEDEMETALPDFENARENCRLQELDPDTARRTFRAMVINSVDAIVSYRCGIEPAVPGFAGIAYFDSYAAISILGNAVQHMSKTILREIALEVARIDKEHRKEEKHEHNISESRGVPDSERNAPELAAAGQVRQDAEEIPAGTPSESIHGAADHRGADGLPAPDGAGNRQAAGEDESRPSADQPGAGESPEQPGMDAAHGTDPYAGGGTGAVGDGVRITNLSGTELASVLSDLGTAVENGKFRIQHAIETAAPNLQNVIRAEYGMFGTGYTFADGIKGYIRSDNTGLYVKKPLNAHEQSFTWAIVRNRIKDLADAGQYLTADETAAYPVYLKEQEALSERKKLADTARTLGDRYGSKSSLQQLHEHLRAFVYENSETARRQLTNYLSTFIDHPAVKDDPEALAELALLVRDLDNVERDAEELGSATDAGIITSFPTDEELDREEEEASQPLARDPLQTIDVDLPAGGEPPAATFEKGQVLTLATGVRYLVTDVSANTVQLQDADHPLFTQDISIATLQMLLLNHANASKEEVPYTGPEPVVSEEISQEEPSHLVKASNITEDRGNKAAQRNYAFLSEYAPHIMDGTLDYVRFESDTYEPLYIERIGENQLAMAHTFVQNGDMMYDPEIVFHVDDEHKMLRPMTYEQSDMGVYQRVYDSDDDTLAHPNRKLERDINDMFRTWSQNLRWQAHTPVRGVKYTEKGDEEYAFQDGKPVLKEREGPAPSPTEPEPFKSETVSVGGFHVTFAPKDVISFGGDEFEVVGAENGKVEFYSLSDGVVSEGSTEQLAAQIAGGGSTRLIPGWSRNVEVYGDRDDQQILADLLNHFNNWRTTDGVYVHSDYYNHCVMDRMYNLRVSDNAAENRRNMIYAAYTVHHFFPRPDNVHTRAIATSSILTRADDYIDSDTELEAFGNIERLPQWREGGEQALYEDLSVLMTDYFAGRIPDAVSHLMRDADPYEAIPVLHDFLERMRPASFADPAQEHIYDMLVREAGLYELDRSALYLNRSREPVIDHPEVLRADQSQQGREDKVLLADLIRHYADERYRYNAMLPALSDADIQAHDNTQAYIMNHTVSDSVETNTLRIKDYYNFLNAWVMPFIADAPRVPEDVKSEFSSLMARVETFDPASIREAMYTEEKPQQGQEPEISFHVGDRYEDAHGGGIITSVTAPAYNGAHAGLIAVKDGEDDPGHIMVMDIARERLRSGEATLTPAEDVELEASRRPAAEPSLFDFDFSDQPEYPEPVTVQAEQDEPDPEGRINYRAPERTVSFGGPKVRFQNNVAAIRLLKELEADARLANREEQEVLARYVGWGGLADAFDSNKRNWSEEYKELKDLLTEDEYAAARESTLTAFYTPVEVTDAIYSVLGNLGFTKGNVLDPGCGIGSFSGRMPASMSKSKVYGIEKDDLSGRIARQLYQKNNITIEGYEDTRLPDNFFDVAVGNVPFGNFKVNDKRYDKLNLQIHDYFFAKTLDKVRPGGVIAFVTSSGTMDKQSTEFRRYLSQRADLLGAIRLPNNTFKTNAGTDVTSDIIFLQKRDIPRVEEAEWVDLDRTYNWDTRTFGPEVNGYFAQNPEMILGEMKEISGPHGPELACIAREGEELKAALTEAVSHIQGDFVHTEEGLYDQEYEERESIPADPDVRNFSFTLVNDTVYFREDSEMFKADLSRMAEQRIKGLIRLRDRVRNLIDAQMDGHSDEAISALQKLLNDEYDAFTKKYGLINSRGNELAFSDDSSYYLLCSLEHVNDKGEFLGKADMFYKRTIHAHQVIDHVETAQEALAVSLSERGRLDFDYMTELSGLTKDQLLKDLQGQVFEDPSAPGTYEISAMYLSGNVREKLADAKEAAEFDADRWSANIEALEAIQPKDLGPGDIQARLGATWIPQEDITQFMYELFDTPSWSREGYGTMRAVYSPLTDTWTITNIDWNRSNAKASTVYGTSRVHGYRLLQDALNNKDTKIYDTVTDADGKEHRVLNQADTLEVQDKQNQIRQAFKDWIWSDPARADRLCKLYNERFNAYVPPTFDGDLVRFHNMNPAITMRPWQKNAVARILFSGNTLLDHAVGAGKTWTMSAAAMEAKYLGLCNKSLIVVPNHLVGQWASAIYEQYPNAKVLASTKKDFETKNRKKFCSRIATGDYDVVVIGHSQFERIPLSAERQKAGLKTEIRGVMDAIAELKAERNEDFTIKQMERTKKQLETRLEKLNNNAKRDDVITFEELGVDRLFVDESHNYKNLFLYTKMQNVAGISQTDSQKASDIFLKCRYMDELTGNKGIIFATGTALSNTMAELYAIQRYLQYDLLQKMGLGTFDQWASTFGETVQSVELAPEGTGYRARTRFARFFNIPELMSLYCQVADIQTKEMLELPLPNAHFENISVPASDIQREYVNDFAERARNIRNGTVGRENDNMLCITNDGRKLALDQRLMDPSLPDYEHSKVNACVDKTFEIWDKNRDEKLTQLIFCDMSIPKPGVFNVYDDIKEKLVARGVPAEEIRFIHEAKNDTQKEALFQQVREGKVRVLLGSTGKLGTGTNVQDLLVAGHDLDCPYRPSDLEQRDGRVIRQKNGNEDVYIYRYVTENTFDAYMYQLLEIKQRFISQIHTPNPSVREAADMDEVTMSFAEIKALASGDPRIKERVELEVDVQKLSLLQKRHENQQFSLKRRIAAIPEELKSSRRQLNKLRQDKLLVDSSPARVEGDKLPPMDVKGTTYEKAGEAGKALLAAYKKSPDGSLTPIAALRGFMILADKREKTQAPRFQLAGVCKFQVYATESEVGTVIRFHSILDRTIPESIEAHEKEISDLEKELATCQEALGLPFPRAAELAEKKERLEVLTRELDIDAQERPIDENREGDIRSGVLDSIIQNARTRQETQMRSGDPSRPDLDHSRI